MTIVVIQGPQASTMPADALPTQLGARARAAGQELVHLRCDSGQQLVERLARIDGGADIILLDPGTCAAGDPALQGLLERLPVPYIEVHADRGRALADTDARLALVDGYAAQGYTLAMSLALETLGCADCENEFNVGT